MRRSFLPPIPQLDQAAGLLDAAVTALEVGKRELADRLVAEANLPEITAYCAAIVGPLTLQVHRRTKLVKGIPVNERGPIRMPTPAEQDAIFARDGWRCRFCGAKVICKLSRRRLARAFALGSEWTSNARQRHSGLYALASSLDHIVPQARGGGNDLSNFVTACYCCQFGRGNFTLEEVELVDPLQFDPIVDRWDGLSRVRRMSSATLAPPAETA